MVLEWENTAGVGDLPPSARYYPRWARTASGARLPVLWNSSVAFQKFQRYLHGSLELDEYLSFLGSHWAPDADRTFCLYGNDWEIIDYRPGMPRATDGVTVERQRLAALLTAIGREARFEWLTPSEVLDRFPPQRTATVTASECPVPTKKQPKYNLTRWAVCGRDNARWNARCHRLHQTLVTAEALLTALRVEAPAQLLPQLWAQAVGLWASDFRTMTTDEKLQTPQGSRSVSRGEGWCRQRRSSSCCSS